MNKTTAVVILAAGKGTRMKSEIPKVLHPVLGKPMLHYVIETALSIQPLSIIPVLSWKKELIQDYLEKTFGSIFRFAWQKEPLGTGDALKAALAGMPEDITTVLVLSGDVPLITADILASLMNAHQGGVTIATCSVPNPSGYGRMIRTDGKIVKIIEEKNATGEQKKINEINTGLYCFDRAFLDSHVPRIEKNRLSGEYYLTDLVDFAAQENIPVNSFTAGEFEMFLGINTRQELAFVTRKMQERICAALMLAGVSIIDPGRVCIEPGIPVGEDSIIFPGVELRGKSVLGPRCVIETGTVIEESTLAADVHIKPYCVIEHSTIEPGASAGPFAHLRPGTSIGENGKIGNFVETKKAAIGRGSKVNHLSYIGDALIEENVNVGAGTITCNYDGEKKHFTHIRKGAFIGSNTALVAPVVVGEGSVVGAGSVITKDVEDDTLAVERSEQRHIGNWSRVKKRLKKKD